MPHANCLHVAQRARFDQFSDFQMRPGVSKMVVGRKDQTGLFSGRNHSTRLVDCHRERLFAHDVLAGCDRCKRLRVVLFVRRRNVDRFNRGIAEHCVQICVRRLDIMLIGIRPSPIRAAAENCGYAIPGLRADGADHVL